jgi:hypothetical protein
VKPKNHTRSAGRMPLKVFIFLLVCCACLFLAALRHQRRALSRAREAMELGRPAMIQMKHLARCVSFNLPGLESTSNTCLGLADRVMAGLQKSRKTDELRTAQSMLYGAIESSAWESDALAARKHALFMHMYPEGAHPLPHALIMPSEPWSYFGVIAGCWFILMAAYLFGIRPLAGGNAGMKRKSAAGIAGICIALFIVFVLCLLAA